MLVSYTETIRKNPRRKGVNCLGLYTKGLTIHGGIEVHWRKILKMHDLYIKNYGD